MSYRASASKGGKAPNGRGQSAAAKHAYHLRQGLYAVGRDGPREDLAASGHGNLPEFAADDPAAFWLASDSFERANGTLYRELQVNLPHELGLTQQQQVLQKFCARMFDRERLPHSWAIHNHADGGDHVPDDNGNGHGHIMVSETMTDDFPRPAEQHFKRHNSAKPEAGGAKKTRSLKPKSWLMEARAAWAEEVNRGLEAAGHKPRFDHRSKEVQLAEALRLGDLRWAARLDTPTQAHEGPRIAGMRRRVEAGKVALDDLPGYAQEVIKSNDQARELARAWLAQVEQMTDAELAEHFAEDLDELREQLAQESPGAHVAAWLDEQHAQALEEDGQRQLAAHDAGMQSLRDRLAALDKQAPAETPAERDAAALKAERKQWESESPLRAWLGLSPSRLSDSAISSAQAAADRARAQAAAEHAAQVERLRSKLKERLLDAEAYRRRRWPDAYAAADQLAEAGRALRRAEGLSENRISRAVLDERAALGRERTEMRELREQIEAAQAAPTLEEAQQLTERAATHLDRMQRWEQIEQQRQAQQLAERVEERLRNRPAPGTEQPSSGPRGPGL